MAERPQCTSTALCLLLKSLVWNCEGEIREVSKLFKAPTNPAPHPPQSSWLGGGILSCSDGLVYFRCASDAVLGACLWMACTCLSQQHRGLWDVFLEAYQVLFSAGMPVYLIQSLNPGKSGPSMSSECFYNLSQKCGVLHILSIP